MMKASAVLPLRESFWQGATPIRERSGGLTDLAGILEIHEVRPWAAMVFEEAARRGEAAYGRLGRLSSDDCVDMATMIEDWQTRYDPEDEPEEAPQPS